MFAETPLIRGETLTAATEGPVTLAVEMKAILATLIEVYDVIWFRASKIRNTKLTIRRRFSRVEPSVRQQVSMSLVPPFLRGSSSFALRGKDNRHAATNLANLSPAAKTTERPKAPIALKARAAEPDQLDPKTVLDMLNHASEALDYLQTRCRELELSAEEAARRAERNASDARKAAETWELRALASEAHVEELEARLAESDQTAMELRARLVCLYGKLTASVDTVRFQTLARALAESEPDTLLSLGAPRTAA